MKIHLSDDHQLDLTFLKQFRTYAGLLEGLPTLEHNHKILQHLVAEQIENDHGCKPYLIEPTQTPYPPSVSDGYPFGKPMRLPKIYCIGQFYSTAPARNTEADYSFLTIIWFQNTWAFPIDEEVIETITYLPWDVLAHDSEY